MSRILGGLERAGHESVEQAGNPPKHDKNVHRQGIAATDAEGLVLAACVEGPGDLLIHRTSHDPQPVQYLANSSISRFDFPIGLEDCDTVMLAQFSTSVAFDAVSSALDCPVLTSPTSAVLKLKAALA